MSLRIFQPGAFGRGVRVAATGAYLPERVVTNADLAALGAPLTDEEMVRLSGIRERRWAAPGEATSDLAAQACRYIGSGGESIRSRMATRDDAVHHLSGRNLR